jgi:serine/threonine protein phosphatase 1
MNIHSLLPWGRTRRPRVRIEESVAALYAVGDVHGCLAELQSLENEIIADARQFPGIKLIVMLGDYVDRGPNSAQVIEHLCQAPPRGLQRLCLAGNHDVGMLDFIDGKAPLESWMAIGGSATLFSYGLDADHLSTLHGPKEGSRIVAERIPAHHVAFLRQLPVLAYCRRFVLVHAGLRPGVAIEDQDDADLLLIRDAFFEGAKSFDRLVIHGHTPVDTPKLDGRRLAIDTGAYFSGRLTAVRIAGDSMRVLTS